MLRHSKLEGTYAAIVQVGAVPTYHTPVGAIVNPKCIVAHKAYPQIFTFFFHPSIELPNPVNVGRCRFWEYCRENNVGVRHEDLNCLQHRHDVLFHVVGWSLRNIVCSTIIVLNVCEMFTSISLEKTLSTRAPGIQIFQLFPWQISSTLTCRMIESPIRRVLYWARYSWWLLHKFRWNVFWRNVIRWNRKRWGRKRNRNR